MRLYNPSTLALLATLTRAAGKGWRDELNEPGRGTFDILVNDADYAQLVEGRLARFFLKGTARWQGVIGPSERQTVPFERRKGPAGKVERFDVPGALTLFDSAVVEPEQGVGRLSPDVRLFNFASKHYDVSSWGAATQLYRQDAAGGNPYASSPLDWEDPLAYWIWSQAESGSPPQPVGDAYFVKTFTMAAQKDCWFLTTADDGMEWYLDGGPLAAERQALMWGRTKAIGLLMDAGTHRLACKATNITRDLVASNRAAVIATLAEATGGGQSIGTVYVRTDNTWKALGYPSVAPTMTPGKIVRVLVEEAQARGLLGAVTLGFTDTLDSAGNAWSVPVDVEYQVGLDSLLSVLRQLGEVTVDVKMAPGSLQLNMWNKPRGTDRSGTVALTPGTNLSGLRHQHEEMKANAALVRLPDGTWIWREDAASISTYGRKEVGLTLGTASSEDQANRTVDQVFAEKVPARPFDEVSARVEWPGSQPQPYTDFDVGDTVTCPKRDGSAGTLRIRSITIGEDVAGYATCVVEGRQ